MAIEKDTVSKNRNKYFVSVLFFITILGMSISDFDGFIDSDMKSKWYWFYISISICGLLLPFYKNKVSLQFGVELLFASIISVALLLVLYGFAQFAGLLPSHNGFKVSGNFDNPAGYASLLALCVPFVLYFTHFNRKTVKYTAWGMYVLIFIAVILSASRSGVLAIVIVTLLHIVKQYKLIFSNLSVSKKMIFAFLIIVFLTGLYFSKKDSANGRVLIWKCTWEMIAEKPFFGHGYKSFEANYMLYQARYLEQNPDSKFTSLADNVKHPFNEFLLLAAEFGIAAFLLPALFIFLSIRLYLKYKNKLNFTLLLVLTGAFVLSCFSYPFKYPFTWFSVVFCIILLLRQKTEKYLTGNRFFRYFIPLLSLVLLTFTIRKMYYEHQWSYLVKQTMLGKTRKVIPEYKKIHPFLRKNAYFLYNYSAELNHIGEFEKSTVILEECAKRLNDYDVQMLQADNYFQLKEYEYAEKHLRTANNMCPNRFQPLYKLHLIHKERNNLDEARILAEFIMEKPVKVNSYTIVRIKKEMDNYLKMP